jgi:H/ACA ribonucleoprotein complex subunit 2
VKKAAKSKEICRGVKEVAKAIRKGAKGVVIIAGDISPIDVITHIPVMCEEASIPYCYVPSKQDLGAAGQTKRPTSIILMKASKDESYEEIEKEVAPMNQ